MVTETELFESTNTKKLWKVIKKEILFNTKINFTFNCNFMFQQQICYTEIINLLRFIINVPKCHRHPQWTLELLYEDRVLMESAFTFLYAGSSIQTADEHLSSLSSLLSYTSLFIQPHKQKCNGVESGYSSSCKSVTIQNATRVHMKSLSQSLT